MSAISQIRQRRARRWQRQQDRKITSVRELNRRIKNQKRYKRRIEMRLDRMPVLVSGELERFSRMKDQLLWLLFHERHLEKYKEAKKSVRKKRRPSRESYFGRGR